MRISCVLTKKFFQFHEFSVSQKFIERKLDENFVTFKKFVHLLKIMMPFMTRKKSVKFLSLIMFPLEDTVVTFIAKDGELFVRIRIN